MTEEGIKAQGQPGALCGGRLSWAHISFPWIKNLLSLSLKSQRGKSRLPGLARPWFEHRRDVIRPRTDH